MFLGTKTSCLRTYLQVVENRREGGRSRQRVVATLGRFEQLQQELSTRLRCPPGNTAMVLGKMPWMPGHA